MILVNESFILKMLERTGLIVLLIYIVLRLPYTKKLFIKDHEKKLKINIFIGISGGLIGIVGTLLGISYKTAITNYRDMGVIFAGFIAGIPGGLIAGLISGTHRFFMGGITNVPCSLATISIGIIAGIYSEKFGEEIFNPISSIFFTATAEIYHLFLVYLIVSPKELAFEISTKFMPPMVLSNSLGVFLLSSIYYSLLKENELLQSKAVISIFKIFEKSTFLINGMKEEFLQSFSKETIKNTMFTDFFIIKDNKVISSYGEIKRNIKISEFEKTILKKQKIHYLKNGKQEKINSNNLKFFSGIFIPLKDENILLEFIKNKSNFISDSQITVAKLIGDFISLQLKIHRANNIRSEMEEMRYRDLLMKTNPHMIFNVLNTISYLSDKEPLKVKELCYSLGNFLRNNVDIEKPLIDLKKELNILDNYIDIMRVRYEDMIEFDFKINAEDSMQLPAFTLQPLVENSLKHGMIPDKKLKISITITQKSNGFKIIIKDNGKGSNSNKEGFGIKSIRKRYENIYHNKVKINTSSFLFSGMVVTIDVGG
ncbi:sensor histidine kinase [Tepiditoga spiralis]|uniref:Sensor histidine kinase n=1 Tax=Tepiditoga spiralis TaxID=2108365 RepID=A0A7G1G8W1_9BACT|nr:LytS/YhcK type 5TM receptor domain-containing protein [Tepiditoga spiralis]BBE30492.1 sensor histidine kinase [Tepiditoga spiralis]